VGYNRTVLSVFDITDLFLNTFIFKITGCSNITSRWSEKKLLEIFKHPEVSLLNKMGDDNELLGSSEFIKGNKMMNILYRFFIKQRFKDKYNLFSNLPNPYIITYPSITYVAREC